MKIGAALLAVAVLAMSGCATVINDRTHPMRVDTLSSEGQVISGADCKLSNDKGAVVLRSGGTAQVRRSSKDLDIVCSMPGQPVASGRAVSRTNAGMWGNILVGGAIGAIVDHKNGSAYTYPTWVQLVFGQMRTFDRKDEDKGQPVVGEAVGESSYPASAVAVVAASESEAVSSSDVIPSAGSPEARAQAVSRDLGCGPVSLSPFANGRSIYVAQCPSGAPMTIDCTGFGCKVTDLR